MMPLRNDLRRSCQSICQICQIPSDSFIMKTFVIGTKIKVLALPYTYRAVNATFFVMANFMF